MYRCTITIVHTMSSKSTKQLAKIFMKVRDPKLAENFLENMLTPPELEEIASRLRIIDLLQKGIPQREVAKKLKVSIGTVSRGARVLKYGKPGLSIILSMWRSSSKT